MRLKTRLAAGLLLGYSVRAADCVIAVSKATARLATLLIGVPSSRIKVIAEGLEESFLPVSYDIAAQVVREQFGIEPDYLLTVGTIEPRKQHGLLLAAYSRLATAPQLVLAGSSGWRSAEVFRRIRGELAARVRYLGRVEDEYLPALYSAARAMVFPSYYEGFGLPVLEAMACGCPVICSRSSSLPEVGGDAVCYFRPGDAEDLSRQIEKIASSAELRKSMSDRGLARAGEFSFAKAASDTLKLMEELVA